MTQQVIIIGAGVGGLAAAHELSRSSEYKIDVYEAADDVGGQARSSTLPSGEHTEYCWHAIARGYNNLPEFLSEIPDTTERKMVLDHVKPLEHYYFITERCDVHDFKSSFLLHLGKFRSVLSQLTGHHHYLDMVRGLKLWFYANSASDEQLEQLDHVSWKKYAKNFTPAFQRWAVDSTSIYMGMEQDDISAHLMLDLLRHNQDSPLLKEGHDFFSFDGPIQEVWFHPWVKFLEKRGVKFHYQHKCERFEYHGAYITAATMTDIPRKITRNVPGDIFINGMSVHGLDAVYPVQRRFRALAVHSHQIQTQVLYHLDYRLPEKKNTVYILHESPWFLMTRHEGSLWKLKQEDYLSCGVGLWNVPGLNGKCAIECTPDELADECWAQMRQFSPYLFQEELPRWNVWPSFMFNPITKRLTTHEPKFSNNVSTLHQRPHSTDDIFCNLYHATAYTRTSMNVFNMESAAEAARLVARDIMGKDQVVVRPAHKPNRLLRTLGAIHRFLCNRSCY